jgi:hypothetical protein
LQIDWDDCSLILAAFESPTKHVTQTRWPRNM